MISLRPSFAIGLCVVLGLAQPARAGFVLVLAPTGPTTISVGQTTTVDVLVRQTAGGPQAGPGNELLTAGISVQYNAPAGVLALPAIAADLAVWDVASTSIDPGTSTASLAAVSVLGVSTFDARIATLTFRGLAPGVSVVGVASLSPGASFITIGGDILDPTNTATLGITVQDAGVVSAPVPPSAGLLLAGVICSFPVRRWLTR